jgi:hypothetical protein
MIQPDQVVAFFEAGSAFLIAKSVLKLRREKLVRGVSAWPICFFGLWGYWNLYWYSFINAPWAWWFGILVVISNTTWAGQVLYYQWRERDGWIWMTVTSEHKWNAYDTSVLIHNVWMRKFH